MQRNSKPAGSENLDDPGQSTYDSRQPLPATNPEQLGGITMQLLTAELRASLPPLYSQETKEDPHVYIKYFTPDSNWTWFVTEGSPDEDNDQDIRFFGFVIGFAEEWGYFMLSELESSRGPLRMPIERDLHFQPGPFSEVLRRHRRTHGG